MMNNNKSFINKGLKFSFVKRSYKHFRYIKKVSA